MKTYFATFIPGFSEEIQHTLKRDYADIQLLRLFASSILFKTNKQCKDVASKPYLNNVFLVLNSFNVSKDKLNGSIVKKLYKDVDINRSLVEFAGKKTFRLIVKKGAELVHIPKEFTKKIINSITHQTNYIYSPLKADVEYWFLIRSEGFAVLGVKFLNFKRSYFHEIRQGQLQPEMANIMNLISEPNKLDLYLDPFAGHGALPLDRAHFHPCKHIYASDNDKLLVNELRKFSGDKLTIQHADASYLSYLKDHSINKIVTDPPWGIYKMQDIDYEIFYKKMLSEMLRVLKEHGLIVLLTAKTAEFENAMTQFKVQLLKKYSTLVNGKKASVYKFTI